MPSDRRTQPYGRANISYLPHTLYTMRRQGFA